MKNNLYTIGYEGSSIDNFISTLEMKGIDVLIDIRDVPISRKPGFSKTALSAALANAGIKYIHLKGLGDPKEGRIAAREKRYSDFEKIFSNHMNTSSAIRDLEISIDIAINNYSCLMCFEEDHRFCHRCIVAKKISEMTGYNIYDLSVNKGINILQSQRRYKNDFEHTKFW